VPDLARHVIIGGWGPSETDTDVRHAEYSKPNPQLFFQSSET